MADNRFDDIRPYYDSEIPAAMQRIAEYPMLTAVSEWLFPGRPVSVLREQIRSITSTAQLHSQVMYPIIQQIIKRSMTQFTYSGAEHLLTNKGMLFVSNHRDIVLDSFLQQLVIYENRFPVAEISFGSNLMKSQFFVDLGKSNKMYRVERKSEDLRKFLKDSIHLSEYIRHLLTEGESIWIAQRNGRTKDGNDLTDKGLLKMFSMSGSKDSVASFEALHIVPVAISYELEPCDLFKAREVYLSRNGKKYNKAPGEDEHSIITGIMQPKGHVHIHLCKAVSGEDLVPFAHMSGTDFLIALADLIDERIYSGYKLYGTNFAAHDKLHGSERFAAKYTTDDLRFLDERLQQLYRLTDHEDDILTSIFLGIYANPVDNCFQEP
ncbi:MAG TPA: 1-acyl-sn-glycerol-3-phosphate acyltransferase [Bacteroidales bacterium]|nr:1-acyl-sn-glycerol-3-phosphate acyltransferase [Bacteroidales bacterium]